MFNVNFYNLSKRENSTLRPVGDGTVFNCQLKDASGMYNPTLQLNVGLTVAPNFNYCYIPIFNRYYFITEWTFTNALWHASCKVDVLASGKDYIGEEDLYILRSSAESDGRVIDTKYMTLSSANSYIDDMSVVTVSHVDGTGGMSMPNYWNTPLNNGYYYIGLTGANGTGVDWYMLTPSGFNTVSRALYDYVPEDMGDIPDGWAKQIANPMQFIVSCYWLPFSATGKLIAPRTLHFGYYDIENVMCAQIDPVNDICKCEATFNIRKHPQANARGVYLNNTPYSNYTVLIQPFGSFNLDASLMVEDSALTCTWYVEFGGGMADLTIKSNNTLLANTKAQLGVPVQLNQAIVDVKGMAESTMGALGGIAKGILSGNYAMGIGMIASSVVGGFVGVAESKQPKVTSIGGGGNFLPFNAYTPKLYSDFYLIADEFNAEIGRPLCKVRKPKNIPGYIVVLDGNVKAPMLQSELIDINNYLVGGFYYE